MDYWIQEDSSFMQHSLDLPTTNLGEVLIVQCSIPSLSEGYTFYTTHWTIPHTHGITVHDHQYFYAILSRDLK